MQLLPIGQIRFLVQSAPPNRNKKEDDMNKSVKDKKTVETPFLGPDTAADYLLMSPSTLRNHRFMGTGPVFRKHGGLIVYHIDDLNKWSRSRTIKR
ncbi:MAG: hypothetical protein ACRBBN_05415 [Methyloligellaceae bacterium]